MSTRLILTVMIFLIICSTLAPVQAQQNTFTYQGKLTANGSTTNGAYDLQFALFDSSTGGLQIGQTQTVTNVTTTDGVFTVALDFGPSAFSGAARFLEISTRPSGGVPFTLLAPRQQISSTPYAVRSLNAVNADSAADAQRLGGVTPDNYVKTGDARLTDARPPAAGSENYIQNTTNQQANSNFSIAGNGNVGGTLTASLANVGNYKVSGRWGLRNAVNGIQVGEDDGNVGIGWFMPTFKLEIRSTANRGLRVQTDGTGGQVASFGGLGDFNIDGPGKPAGRFTVKDDGSLGVGIDSPTARFHFVDPGNAGLRVDTTTPGGTVATFGSRGEFHIDANGNPGGGRLNVKENGTVLLGDCPGCFPNVTDRLVVNGTLRILSLGNPGTQSLCRNNLNQISFCSSSLRYKTDLLPFRSGLNLINRLHPITFRWKTDQSLDLGLGAEDVAAVEPLLVTHNDKGEVEGVKYDRINVVLINAIKEQQAQITSQAQRIKSQEDAIAALQAQMVSLKAVLRHSRHHRNQSSKPD